MADFRQEIWRPNFWPRDGNKTPRFGARYLTSIFLASQTAIKMACSRRNIWHPHFWLGVGNENCRYETRYLTQYFWPHNSNENGQFRAKYLASKFLASRRQIKMADSRKDIWRPYFLPHDCKKNGQFDTRNLVFATCVGKSLKKISRACVKIIPSYVPSSCV